VFPDDVKARKEIEPQMVQVLESLRKSKQKAKL
jgi:hypothetical protein